MTDEDFKKAMEDTIVFLNKRRMSNHAAVVFEAGTRIKDLERNLKQTTTTLTRVRGQLDEQVDRSNKLAGKPRAV